MSDGETDVARTREWTRNVPKPKKCDHSRAQENDVGLLYCPDCGSIQPTTSEEA